MVRYFSSFWKTFFNVIKCSLNSETFNSLRSSKRLNQIAILRFFTLGWNVEDKAELLLQKLIHLFAREVLLVKKMKIEETKTTKVFNF